jgi:hypothetical protein
MSPRGDRGADYHIPHASTCPSGLEVATPDAPSAGVCEAPPAGSEIGGLARRRIRGGRRPARSLRARRERAADPSGHPWDQARPPRVTRPTQVAPRARHAAFCDMGAAGVRHSAIPKTEFPIGYGQAVLYRLSPEPCRKCVDLLLVGGSGSVSRSIPMSTARSVRSCSQSIRSSAPEARMTPRVQG